MSNISFKKQGFTIVEWLVSFCITVLLVTLVFQFLVSFYTGYLERASYNAIFSQGGVALDHISREISCAPCQKSLWRKVDPTHILWHDEQNNRDIGYVFKKQNLYFLVRNKQNKKTRKNLLVRNIQNVTFTMFIKHTIIQSVQCCIVFGTKDATCCLERIISIKNRVLL